MENKTKIILLQAKELIYTSIFILLGIILVVIFLCMFGNHKNKKDSSKALYHPGTYTSSIALGDSSFDVCVTVSEHAITDVTFDQLDDSVATMYPLFQTAMDSIQKEIKETGSIDDISFEADYQYTGTVIKQAITSALKKAER